MIPLIWLSHHDDMKAIGPWDTGMLQRMFEGDLWPTTAKFDSSWTTESEIPEKFHGQAGVVVLPSRHHYNDIDWLNEQINKLSGVVLVLCSDEEAKFPWKGIHHPNIRWWVQSGDDFQYADAPWAYFFGYGWRYEFPEWAAEYAVRIGKRRDYWVFAGQVTNDARRRAAAGLLRANKSGTPGLLLETAGFSQGMGGDDYAEALAEAWVAPCPAGPLTLDTFRLYEALELGCIPLVDGAMPDGSMFNFWKHLYGWAPIRVVQDWSRVGNDFDNALLHRQLQSAEASAWWQQKKREMVKRLDADLRQIGCPVEPWTRVTAVVTSSPVPSNPDTEMIMEILHSLPDDIEVIVALDGIRPEQEHLREAYDEFRYRIAMWCEHDAVAAIPAVAQGWKHQVGLTRLALQIVDTPVVLFMEHDTPLNRSDEIDWENCIEVVAENHLDVLRFHHEGRILEVHQHLMIDHGTKEMLGVPLRRTFQWSQRPSLYNTDYLRRILEENFSPKAKCFIEDKMHSVAQTMSGHRLAIYHPEGDIRRSGHLDGRAGGEKFSDTQVF